MNLRNYLSQVRTVTAHHGLATGVRMSAEHAWRRVLAQLGRWVNYGQKPLDVDWDVLLVLDACRADLFQEFAPRHELFTHFDLMGSAYSCASSSPEWFEKGFQEAPDSSVSDVVYVTQNAHFENVDRERFYDTLPLHRVETDNKTGLLSPSEVTDAALSFYADKDADRFVVHYMPPHAPFQYANREYEIGNVPWAGSSQGAWWGLQTGDFDREQVWQDYGENLLGVLDEVQRIVKHVTGDVIITSDHGNAMGELGLYAHPAYVPAPAVKSVPWVELEGRGIKYDAEGFDTPSIEQGESVVEGRLEALGYK